MRPTWQAEGWRPNGPFRCICPVCGETVSTNAYARRTHERTHPKATAPRKPADANTLREAIRKMAVEP